MPRKLLSLMIASLLVLCAFCGCSGSEESSAVPDDAFIGVSSDEMFDYAEYGGYVQISKYEGTETEVEIPSSYNGKPVTAVNDAAFYNNSAITSVVIPEGVETIGKNAFSGCVELTYAVFPSTLTSIGSSAFVFCKKLNNVEIPASVESIDNHAFRECTVLGSVKILADGISFGDSVFAFCSQKLIITGNENSTAKEYAEKNGIEYKVIG